MSEFSLQIEPIGENEYSLSVTLESVLASNVVGAGNLISRDMWVGTWNEYLALPDRNETTLYLITTPTGTGLPVVSVNLQNQPQQITVAGYVSNGVVSMIQNNPQTILAYVQNNVSGIAMLQNHIQMLIAQAEKVVYDFEDRALYAYGVTIDETNTSPTLPRVGNATMAQNAEVNAMAKMGLLNSETGVLKLLDPDDARYYADGSGLAPLDGSAGNIMSYMPPFYYYVEQLTATSYNLWVSPHEIENFQQHPGWCLGATQAVMNNEAVFGKPSGALWSVVNESTVFRGSANTPSLDALEGGGIGKPRTRLTRQAFFDAAQTQGEEFGLMHYSHHAGIVMLFITKYATLQSQQAVSAKVNGYFAGGLGNGSTDLLGPDWNTYNAYFPVVKTGVTMHLGLNDGEVAVTLNDWPTGPKTTYECCFLGLQGLYGNIATILQGVNIEKTLITTGVYSHKAFIYDGLTYEDSSVANAVREVSYNAQNEGYMTSIVGGPHFDPLAKSRSIDPINANQYWCDHFNNPTTTGDVGVFGMYVGGFGTRDTEAGISFAFTGYRFNMYIQYLSTRLSYYGAVTPTL